MASSVTLRSHGRTDLVNQRNLSVVGSTGLVTLNAGAYSRFTGFFSGIGSMTSRVRFGTDPANFYVSSTFVVNSGPQVFDVFNLGKFVEWTITAANSQSLGAALIIGEPIR